MGLYLYHSNRVECLCDALLHLYQQRPLKSPFVPEEILIATGGIERYIDREMSKGLGIAANIRYSRIPVFWWRIAASLNSKLPETNKYAPEVLTWRLWQLFAGAWQDVGSLETAQKKLTGYLHAHRNAAYDLASEMAKLFDQYATYRPEWMVKWCDGCLVGKLGADEPWQQALWRALIDSEHGAQFRYEPMHTLYEQLQQSTRPLKLPERVTVFAVSAMAPMYLQLFEALSRQTDVHFFLLNPCADYWGDIRRRTMPKANVANMQLPDHPLLASLGSQGRDFFDALLEVEAEEISLFAPVQRDTLLHALQADIQTLEPPQNHMMAVDDSIVIRNAHSPLRELQALKDAILAYLDAHPERTVDDIAVLSPQIEAYIPYVEGVFGKNAVDRIPLAYSIADTKISRYDAFLAGWGALLDVFASQMEVDIVWRFISNQNVMTRFEISAADLAWFNELLQQMPVFWAEDGVERQADGGRGDDFTWQYAQDRLLAGLLLPERMDLWQNIAPYGVDEGQHATVMRFLALLQKIMAYRQQWRQTLNLSDRIKLIHCISSELLDDNQASANLFFQAVKQFEEDYQYAQCDVALPADVIAEYMKKWLNQTMDAGYLRGGITFCSMVPLRNLPFAYLALLGMNSDAYPRAGRELVFDLMALNPRRGDRSRRDDDRYLFLECLLSARDVLYLSYIGRDIQNNATLAPSVLLTELADTLSLMTTGIANGVDYLQQHEEKLPLQVFSPRHFMDPAKGGVKTRSYRADYAVDAQQTPDIKSPFFSKPDADQHESTAVQQEILWEDFLTFWHQPVRSWLQHHLRWKGLYQRPPLKALESFTPRQWQYIHRCLLEIPHNDEAKRAKLEAKLRAMGLYPAAYLQEYWQQYHRQLFTTLPKDVGGKPFYREPFSLDVEGYHLEGSLNDWQSPQQLIQVAGKNIYVKDRLQAYLKHLVANAVSAHAVHTYIIGVGEYHYFEPVKPADARQRLILWLRYYSIGQQQPLAFFLNSSMAAAEVLQKKDKLDGVEPSVVNAWQGFKRGQKQIIYGDCDNQAIRTVFGRDVRVLQLPEFQQLALELLVPLCQTEIQG